MYEGRTDMETGRVLGHENLGRVVEVGPAVQKIKVGDMVAVPFNVACGHCENCEKGLTNYCLIANPDPQIAGAAYGFADMGPWGGGQAEYLMVPWADFSLLQLPDDAEERQNDYVMLSDIFPTGYHATEMAGVQPGETVVIYGGGPAGLMAALSATLKNASKVMVVDRHPDRLALADKIGAKPIDDSAVDPVDTVMRETNGLGADSPAPLAWSVSTCPPIPVARMSWPSTARWPSTSACSGSRARRWAPASARSSATTGTCAISFTPAKRTRRSSSPTSSRWSASPRAASTSTHVTTAGPR
jgi:Zn-dependent alcohol dehydrogenase